jgi:hypothetical protein
MMHHYAPAAPAAPAAPSAPAANAAAVEGDDLEVAPAINSAGLKELQTDAQKTLNRLMAHDREEMPKVFATLMDTLSSASVPAVRYNPDFARFYAEDDANLLFAKIRGLHQTGILPGAGNEDVNLLTQLSPQDIFTSLIQSPTASIDDFKMIFDRTVEIMVAAGNPRPDQRALASRFLGKLHRMQKLSNHLVFNARVGIPKPQTLQAMYTTVNNWKKTKGLDPVGHDQFGVFLTDADATAIERARVNAARTAKAAKEAKVQAELAMARIAANKKGKTAAAQKPIGKGKQQPKGKAMVDSGDKEKGPTWGCRQKGHKKPECPNPELWKASALIAAGEDDLNDGVDHDDDADDEVESLFMATALSCCASCEAESVMFTSTEILFDNQA